MAWNQTKLISFYAEVISISYNILYESFHTSKMVTFLEVQITVILLSKTHLSSLADLSRVVAWTVSILPQISSSLLSLLLCVFIELAIVTQSLMIMSPFPLFIVCQLFGEMLYALSSFCCLGFWVPDLFN